MPSAVDPPSQTTAPSESFSPLPSYPVKEAHFESYLAPQPDGYQKAKSRGPDNAAIVIDNGSSSIRAGWSFEDAPRFSIPAMMAKYRDRKYNRTYQFVGNDVYTDTNARSHTRYAFEAGTGIIANWDVMESVLDYIFLKMGIDGQNGSVDVPIVMTEAVANLPYSRKSMTEIIFECYGAPSLAYGIDSLFSYNYNNGRTGLVVSASHSSTHLIPVYNSKALLPQATRLNWGGYHCAEYLLKLLKLKYPSFLGKLTHSAAEDMVKDHCYVSTSYDSELSSFLDWTGLEERSRVIQYPFTEEVIIEKSPEELARIAEKRKESGRRLQEQAAKQRLEKLVRKEQELDYYRDLQNKLANESKKEVRRLLNEEELSNEAALAKKIKDLDTSIRKSRQKDVGGEVEEEAAEEPKFPLLDVPDAELDEAGLKEKRQQRLMKSNKDARDRAKAEKAAEAARIAEIARLDVEKRTNDLDAWLAGRRAQHAALKQRLKERERAKADLGNRKSDASKIRMREIAKLASDGPTKKRRRNAPGGGGEGGDDDFGKDDDDWAVYRDVRVGGGDGSDDEEEEDLDASMENLEKELLEYDPEFDQEMTMASEKDWRKSLVHAFLRGPRPFEGSTRENHQLHLNVERIRVPEVFWQPSIAGVDQAGVADIAADILTHRLGSLTVGGVKQEEFLKDVFLTGGSSMFERFDERLRKELRCVLPAEAELCMRRAKDPLLDAWRGAARWAGSEKFKGARITRAEYQEKGAEYLKEHDLGNAFS